MAISWLDTLSERLANPADDDPAAHRESLDLLVQVSSAVRGHCSPEVTSCLVAAGHILQALGGETDGVGLDRARLREMAGELVRAVASELDGERTPPAPRARPAETGELRVPAVEGPGSAMPVAAEEQPETQSDPLLGRVLMKLGRVDRDQLAAALRFHRQKGLPLGECLLLLGTCPPELILDALKVQVHLRQAMEAETADAAPAPGPDAGDAATASSGEAAILVRDQMFLGEVLLGCGMITNDDLEKAMHMHHLEGVLVGEALQKLGVLTAEQIASGLELKGQLERLVRPSTAPPAHPSRG